MNMTIENCREPKLPPEPPFLQALHAPSAAPHSIGAPDTFPVPFPSLDMLQSLNVILVVRELKLTPGFEVGPQQCSAQRDGICSGPAGHIVKLKPSSPAAAGKQKSSQLPGFEIKPKQP